MRVCYHAPPPGWYCHRHGPRDGLHERCWLRDEGGRGKISVLASVATVVKASESIAWQH